MSHMGCADEPGHPLNGAQLAEFRRLTDGLGRPRSLSATAGMLLGPDCQFDLVRPGIGLYGGLPFADAAARRDARGADHPDPRPRAGRERRLCRRLDRRQGRAAIATVGLGYADGLIRASGARGAAWIAGRRVPFAGRVSMDLVTLDVTDCPCAPGDMVEFIGPAQGIDAVAEMAGTIGHEVLTALGGRYRRHYIQG